MASEQPSSEQPSSEQPSSEQPSSEQPPNEPEKFVPLPISYGFGERHLEHTKQFVIPLLRAAGLLPDQLPPIEKAKWDIDCALTCAGREKGMTLNFNCVKQESEQPLPNLEITKFTYEICVYHQKN